MKKKPKLLEIIYNCYPRAVGHTHAEINGVKNSDNAVLIVASHHEKLRLIEEGFPMNKMVTITECPRVLIGKRNAVVIDHHALYVLVNELVQNYEKEIRYLKRASRCSG